MDAPYGPQGPRIEIVAQVLPGGVECPLVRDTGGAVYSITGLPNGIEISDRLRINGHVMNISICMQGKTIRAERVEILQRSHSGIAAMPGR